jgi:signal peptidase I
MRRGLAWTLGVIVLLAILLVVLDKTFLLTETEASGTSSEAPTFACDDRGIAEGFTYKFRDPRRGETVVFHARGRIGGNVVPDPDARDLGLMKRVAGVPGDQVVARDGRVFVNGIKFDDIKTNPFSRADLGADEYFVLGDNRSFSQDSRDFGPVPRSAIYGRAIFVLWPPKHFGRLPSRKAGPSPGGLGYCD